jgi:hypothetical protein
MECGFCIGGILMSSFLEVIALVWLDIKRTWSLILIYGFVAAIAIIILAYGVTWIKGSEEEHRIIEYYVEHDAVVARLRKLPSRDMYNTDNNDAVRTFLADNCGYDGNCGAIIDTYFEDGTPALILLGREAQLFGGRDDIEVYANEKKIIQNGNIFLRKGKAIKMKEIPSNAVVYKLIYTFKNRRGDFDDTVIITAYDFEKVYELFEDRLQIENMLGQVIMFDNCDKEKKSLRNIVYMRYGGFVEYGNYSKEYAEELYNYRYDHALVVFYFFSCILLLGFMERNLFGIFRMLENDYYVRMLYGESAFNIRIRIMLYCFFYHIMIILSLIYTIKVFSVIDTDGVKTVGLLLGMAILYLLVLGVVEYRHFSKKK